MTESQLSLLHLAKAEISEKKNETNKSRLMQLRSRNSTEKCGEYENSDISSNRTNTRSQMIDGFNPS